MSFEAKLQFPVKRKSGKINEFNVNIFMFLPHGLDVNKHNYTREDFYNSLKTSIRLTTPVYKLNQLINDNGSPFSMLLGSLNLVLNMPGDKTVLEYEKQIKRFCSVFNVALRYDASVILRTRNVDNKEVLISQFHIDIKKIRNSFIDLRSKFDLDSTNDNVMSIYQHADEYQSLLVEKHVAFIVKSLTKLLGNKSDLVSQLEKIVVDEMDYRLDMKYPSVAIKNQPYSHLLHRMARLKKFIESNLYLNTDTRKEGVVVEQLLFSIAAGIAMVFATAVAFASQLIYGNLSLPFFIALVIGYMFKDRIKELVRIYFSKKHQKVFYDFKTKIFSQNKKKIGSLKESFNFVRHSHLPPEILKVRNNMRATEITEESLGEKIIHYRTKVRIRSKKKVSDDFSGITQILRFNIADIIRKMDDPEKEILIRTKNGFKRVYSDRVYHINIILTLNDDDSLIIKPYKIYANRKGIRRIERVNKLQLAEN